jgi:HSP20 family protein
VVKRSAKLNLKNMPLIPWRPFSEIEKFFSDDDWLFPLGHYFNEPAMDIYETDNEIVAKLNVPGVDPENINISVDNQTLRVSGKFEDKKEEKSKNYLRREIRYGSFERVAHLPMPVKEDKVEATYDKGVLQIVMPKAEKAKSEKKIKVKIKK